MQLTMEQLIFIVKSYYEVKRCNQVQTKFILKSMGGMVNL